MALRGQLDAYFAETLRAFDLPLAPQETPFQMAVWALMNGSLTGYAAGLDRKSTLLTLENAENLPLRI